MLKTATILSCLLYLLNNPIKLYGPGALAHSLILEEVAERRVRNKWNLDKDWTQFEVLLAMSDCGLLGKEGWLMVGYKIKTAIVIDCENADHKGQMKERGLLADINWAWANHKEGVIALR